VLKEKDVWLPPNISLLREVTVVTSVC